MIHIDLRQPLSGRISLAARDPKRLVLAAVQDPAILGAALVLLASGVSASTLEARLTAREAEVEAQLAEAAAEAAQLGEALEQADALRAEQLRLQARVQAIQGLDPDRYAFVRLMDQVAAQTPEHAWLQTLVVDARNARDGSLRFRVRGFSPSVELVNTYQRGLLAAGAARDLQLTGSGSIRVGGVPVIRFELSGTTSPPHGAGGSYGDPSAEYADAGSDAATPESRS